MRLRSLTPSLLVLFGALLGVAGTSIGAGVLGSSLFPDVRSGSFYDEAVGELSQAGIIHGYADGRFGPNDYVTRGQVAVLMQRLRDDLMGNVSSSSTSSSSSSSSSSSTSTSTSSSTSSSSSSISVTSAGSFRFTLSNYTVDEDKEYATISVVRVGGNEGSVSVQYAATASTATNEQDFEVVSGTLTFANHDTSEMFSVRILDDTTGEANETITLTLSGPTGSAVLNMPSTATITIIDDDGGSSSSSSSSSAASSDAQNTIEFSAVGYDVAENAGQITISVVRKNPSGTASVQYATQNGTATSGTQYTAANGTLEFASGETSKTFTVSIADNSQINGSKTVTLKLQSPSASAVLGYAKEVLLTIIDDEVVTFGTGALKFAQSSFEVEEADTTAYVTVIRSGGTKGTVTVEYATTGGTAIIVQDYTATSGILTFVPGEAKKVFPVQIFDDEYNDSGELINLRISNPTGGALLSSPATATLVIQ